jgi:hypothetical protein
MCMNIPDLSQLAIQFFRIRMTKSHKGIQIHSRFLIGWFYFGLVWFGLTVVNGC